MNVLFHRAQYDRAQLGHAPRRCQDLCLEQAGGGLGSLCRKDQLGQEYLHALEPDPHFGEGRDDHFAHGFDRITTEL